MEKYYRPSDRVARAMWRITRDKWIDGETAFHIAVSLARCCSANAVQVAGYALGQEYMAVGLWRGKPPAFLWEKNYRDVLRAVERCKNKSGEETEIEILKVIKPLGLGIKYRENNR